MSTRMDLAELDKLLNALKEFDLCDECLGRQFRRAFLCVEGLPSLDNKEIGFALRNLDKVENLDIPRLLDQIKQVKQAKKLEFDTHPCYLCEGIFLGLGDTCKRVCELVSNYDFKTFLIGVRLPKELLEREEKVWSRAGAAYAEPIKKSIARQVGICVSNELEKDVSFERPDMTIILDFRKDIEKPGIDLEISSLFLYGEYQKLVPDIPQTKWICPRCNGKGCRYCNFVGKLYPESVEEIIARPILAETGGKGTKFHGAGREDRDVVNLGWRPFVIEVLSPVVRDIDLKKVEGAINSGDRVKVRGIRYSDKKEVIALKEARFEKTYEAIVDCQSYSGEELADLETFFKGRVINQRTPNRVVHRRADKIRKRMVRWVKCEPINNKSFKAIIRAESGTYIKELVSGDNGRTSPSFSEKLGKQCNVRELKVLEVHME